MSGMTATAVVALQILAAPELADVPLDPARLQREIAADADVVRSLESNGDLHELNRSVEVRYKGPRKNLLTLTAFLKRQGWRTQPPVKLNGKEYALDNRHVQNTEPLKLIALTTASLKIDHVFGVDYDGWGCVAQTGQK